MVEIKILFLAANPRDTDRLMLDEEAREIELKIRASACRDSLRLITKWAVRPDDLLQYLNEHKPDIVHFSGHGSVTEEIVLTSDDSSAKPVSKQGLLWLFRTLKDNVRLVVLNACYSKEQAQAIVEAVGCAVGMSKAIGDRAAIKFAASFYRAIGFGRSIKEAFEQGQTALILEGIPEEATPDLLSSMDVDPSQIVLADPQ